MYWDSDLDNKYYQFDADQRAYLNSGSTCISGPFNEVMWMNAKLNALLNTCTLNGTYQQQFACSAKSVLPDFFLNFGDYMFRVRMEDYVVPLSSGSS